MVDGLQLFRLFTGTKLFDLPGTPLQHELLQRLRTQTPTISSDEPVLCEIWANDTETQYHLMNYADKPQKVALNFDKFTTGEVISPDYDMRQTIAGLNAEIQLNVYSIVIVKDRT
jgi:hypothetical protein